MVEKISCNKLENRVLFTRKICKEIYYEAYKGKRFFRRGNSAW